MENSDDGYSTSTYDYPRNYPVVCKSRLKREALQLLLKDFKRRNDWHSHGKLKKVCGGCILASPVNLWWWMAEIFILVTVAMLTYKFILIDWALVIPAIVIAAVQWLAFYRTCMRDPGVQPRPPFSESFKNAIKASKKWSQNLVPTSIIEHPNGRTEVFQYCWKCHHFRNCDTTHCGTCDCCMIQHDHHCPVFGGCVAKHNLSSFHAMIVTIIAFWLYAFGYCAFQITSSSVKQGKPSAEEQKEYDAAYFILYLMVGEIAAVLLVPHVITPIVLVCTRNITSTTKRNSQTEIIPESEQIKEMIKFVRENLGQEEEQILLSLLPEEDTITGTTGTKRDTEPLD
ncbi:putative palmitoyltransferase ZDHHC14 [Orchesella cincta]|uniref:Palmitoyltransferase n=1 Tax=Orchesella cincta TaxID=48709 RepID=A0A1D2NFP9_ORCCI|nr:putative palmitoyltransferase ZDHHC14 [Orchesella cincta]